MEAFEFEEALERATDRLIKSLDKISARLEDLIDVILDITEKKDG